MQKRFLIFGAHPDDPDIMFGGAGILLARAGHKVKFVSVTDGGAGHHEMKREELVERRKAETRASRAIAGIDEYQVLDNPDARLEPTVAVREQLIRIIREYHPDVVISHRLCDYHPDHRNTAQLILDTSFLVGVPLVCPETPVPEKTPVYAYVYDEFTDPRPIRPDAAVDVTEVMELKLRMLDCQKSQFYEWLPWVDLGRMKIDEGKMSWPERREWLDSHWGIRSRRAAELAGLPGRAEVFELSPYGRAVKPEEFRELFRP